MRFSVLDMLKRVSLTLSNPFQIFVLIFVPTCSSPPFSLFLSLPSSSSSAFLAATRRDNDKTWLRARNGSCYALRSRHHLGGSLLLHAHFPTLPSPAAAPLSPKVLSLSFCSGRSLAWPLFLSRVHSNECVSTSSITFVRTNTNRSGAVISGCRWRAAASPVICIPHFVARLLASRLYCNFGLGPVFDIELKDAFESGTREIVSWMYWSDYPFVYLNKWSNYTSVNYL